MLATLQGRRLAGIALTMGLGKTLIGLRDMARLLAAGPLPQPGAGTPFLVAAPTQAILDSLLQEAREFGLAHLLDQITFTTYRSLAKTLAAGSFHKLYLDECYGLKDSHEPGLRAHAARQGSILGLTGTPPAQAHSEKGRLVATYCPIIVDYTTDEAVLAGLLNNYRLVVHPLPLRTARDYVLTTKAGSQFTTSEREHYAYWSKRLAHAAQDPLRILRMQALMSYPGKGHYIPNTPRTSIFRPTRHCDIQRLACVVQFSEGISIPNLRSIIWHAFGNERRAAQRISRLLRLNPDQTATVHLLTRTRSTNSRWPRPWIPSTPPKSATSMPPATSCKLLPCR
ncbi:hypothetical protein E4631_22455 [Hymenobacter sp. UV11]|uniref:DEAD/DEAH box helicase n=1 Tax=Hymenobacter sp. UV11 TaxID=1849735 RepID=UPI00105BF9B0|nr:hypothetical protein [Hymenobacter sp. UV11]TDN38735.1 hypothetical protein A8B98_00300 [Hymenobacter sp. UV11]TFZ63442.1 hypothetical protein E4631_22455 [Hymenobacter sp. UV11]